MTELLVYTTFGRAALARTLLGAACAATGATIRLEQYGTGSLYQRLGSRHGPPPPPDVVIWGGPFGAAAAAADGLLQAYQPRTAASSAPHDASWRWTALDLTLVSATGMPALTSFDDVAGMPRIALADPERSETGLSVVLATLDRSRQVDGDVERGWQWWAARSQRGVVLAGDDDAATSEAGHRGVSHALVLSETAPPLAGLAPIPHAVSVTASTRNLDAARALVDWLVGESAAGLVRLSPWTIGRGPLGDAVRSAPALDVEWARQSYTATRKRWSQSGFGAALPTS